MLALLPQAMIGSESTPWEWVVFVIALVGEVLAISFVLRVLARGGAPASTLLWVVVILGAPWIGMALYYLFPRRLQNRRLATRQQRQEQRRSALGRSNDGTVVGDAASTTAGPSGSAIEHLLRGIADDELSTGNRVTWLPGGEAFFDAAKSAVERASHCVELEVYILRPDRTGLRLLETLTATALRGVTVRLLYDSFGSWGLKDSHLQPLRQAGGRALAFHPLLWKRRPFTVNLRDHRKILVVDGAVGFVGGRNVGDEYATDLFSDQRPWHDAMLQIEGPGSTALRALFAENWFHVAEEELHEDDPLPTPSAVGGQSLSVVASGPDRDLQELWFAAFQAISMARTSINMSSPYLVPPPTLLFALEVAARRGVAVRVYTNGRKSEAFVLYNAQRSYYESMIAAGIEIRETEVDYNHAKLLVVDEQVVMIGSANLDMRSAHLNWEVAVVLPDSPELAREVVQTIEDRYSGRPAIVADDLSSSMIRRVFDGFCRLLSPLL